MTVRRRVSRWVFPVVLTFLGTKLAVLLVNLRLFPTLQASPADRADSRRVALLIPVRDEMHRLPGTLPGLLKADLETVFLDDRSTDGTADFLRRAAPAATVLRGWARPPGWVGKTWACAQLAEATDAEVLVFCDADVELSDGAVAAVVREMGRQQADVFSVFPRQSVGSWSERLLTPLVTDVLLCLLPFPLLSAPAPSAAVANGSILAFTRDAYRRVGGFEAVRGELVEDVAMARRTRRLGLKLGLALGGDLVRVRMYSDFPGVVSGLGRGLTAALGGRRWPVVAALALHLLAYTAPVVLVASRRWRWAAALGIVERLLVEAKTGGHDWVAAAVVSAAPVVAVPVVRQALRREQVWKGRRYS